MGEFVLRQFIAAVAVILDSLLTLYFWVVLIAALLSWVNPDPRNPIVRFLYAVTEPVLYQIRRRLPFVHAAGLDFSPLVLMLAIQFTKMVVVQSLYELAARVHAALPGAVHVV
jgi:YggT family protein